MSRSNHKPSALDKLIQEAMGEGKTFGNADDPARQRWPQVWEWLSRCYVGRDNIKQPAVLSIRLGPQGVLASLVDRDLAASVNVSCLTLESVFQAIEDALTGPNPPLSTWGRKEPRLRKRPTK